MNMQKIIRALDFFGEVWYTMRRLRPRRTVAQLVEHDTFNVGVAGSIPASPTTLSLNVYSDGRSIVD